MFANRPATEPRRLTELQVVHDEKGKILSFIDVSRNGLEVGAGHDPVCPKSSGFNVEVLDHLDQAALRRFCKIAIPSFRTMAC